MKKYFIRYRSDIVLLFILCIISVIPRFLFLDAIPPGLHGDEGWTGLDARTIIANGSIAPYVGSALGTPTGSLYLPALLMKSFGESIFVLRSGSAIQGVLSILLFYIFFRIFFTKKIAFLTSLAISLSLFHFFFSRTAFVMVNVLPFQLVTLIALFGRYGKAKLIQYVIAGIACGLGMYSYNVYPLFPFSILIYLFLDTLLPHFEKIKLIRSSLFLIFFVLFSLPLILFIIHNTDFYLSHHKTYSAIPIAVNNSKDLIQVVEILIHDGLLKTKDFFTGYKVDSVDGYGYSSSFSYSYLIIALIGLILSLLKPSKISLFFLGSFLIMLLPLFFTIEGVYRRQILALPYLYYFMAFAIFGLERIVNKRKALLYGVLITIVTTASCIDLHSYFYEFPNKPSTQYIYPFTETQAGIILGTIIKPTSKVIFYSSRWSCHYETIRYLTTSHPCEDRSNNPIPNFSINSEKGEVIFALLSGYSGYISELKSQYPNGHEYFIRNPKSNAITGIIYAINLL